MQDYQSGSVVDTGCPAVQNMMLDYQMFFPPPEKEFHIIWHIGYRSHCRDYIIVESTFLLLYRSFRISLPIYAQNFAFLLDPMKNDCTCVSASRISPRESYHNDVHECARCLHLDSAHLDKFAG